MGIVLVLLHCPAYTLAGRYVGLIVQVLTCLCVLLVPDHNHARFNEVLYNDISQSCSTQMCTDVVLQVVG